MSECTCEYLIDFEDGYGPQHSPTCPLSPIYQDRVDAAEFRARSWRLAFFILLCISMVLLWLS